MNGDRGFTGLNKSKFRTEKYFVRVEGFMMKRFSSCLLYFYFIFCINGSLPFYFNFFGNSIIVPPMELINVGLRRNAEWN